MKYWVDLESVELSDNDEPVWLQALPINTYTHPLHGTIDVTPERAARFAENVNNKVRGQDLDIDYDHKVRSGEAAGWVVRAEARLNEVDAKQNGLWIAVQFTKAATQKLKEKAYRYFSADFLNQWKHPATNKQFNDVLCGGALTNRPFLKDILPINLSDVTEDDKPKEGSSVDKLRETLGLPETATDDEVIAAAEALKANQKVVEAPKEEPKETPKADATELAEAMKKLAEENPIVQMLLSERETDRKRMNDLEKANRLSEVNVKLSELSKGKHVVAPAQLDEIRALAVELPVELSDKMFNVLGNIVENGIVQLGEIGKTNTTESADASVKFGEAINKVMDEKKCDYTTALSEVVAADPGLFDAYNEELLNK